MATDNEVALDELRALAADELRARRRLELRTFDAVRRHRARGVPWSVIGDGLGVGKSAAHERWAGPVRTGHLDQPTPPQAPGPVQDALL